MDASTSDEDGRRRRRGDASPRRRSTTTGGEEREASDRATSVGAGVGLYSSTRASERQSVSRRTSLVRRSFRRSLARAARARPLPSVSRDRLCGRSIGKNPRSSLGQNRG
eukprot:28401-Pelagococcus_subviridis.AAC.10